MAKMTIGPVTYEGTPEELQAIVATFPTDDADVAPAEVTPIKTFEDFAKGDNVRLLSGGGSHPLGGYEIGEQYEVDSNDAENGNQKRYISLKGGSIHRGYAMPEQLEKVTQAKPKTPADLIRHNGADYSLVQRKAQAGDVVVFTENTSVTTSINVPHGPVTKSDGELFFKSGHAVYRKRYNRTEANVLVYEKVAVEAPKRFPQYGDIVRVTSDHYQNGFTEGAIGIVADADGTFSPEIKVCGKRGYARVEIVAEAESRADMR